MIQQVLLLVAPLLAAALLTWSGPAAALWTAAAATLFGTVAFVSAGALLLAAWVGGGVSGSFRRSDADYPQALTRLIVAPVSRAAPWTAGIVIPSRPASSAKDHAGGLAGRSVRRNPAHDQLNQTVDVLTGHVRPQPPHPLHERVHAVPDTGGCRS
ncbi:hypothetical protein OHA72_46560 [Dactylosporangium sp. NBC_01737]|uniref:hypothetical protein n=1 Tax=Dactylosporangium sp. NBC_01737 TaxID=2975959 RepID=UPI002E131D93|nr:hypothetical protein OHA72_46560 [Dactylosporangium sp. NBC_01737]